MMEEFPPSWESLVVGGAFQQDKAIVTVSTMCAGKVADPASLSAPLFVTVISYR
jgi:hypothetical protein